MKRSAIVILLISLLLVAGCFTQAPREAAPGSGSQIPASTDPLTAGKPLPMLQHATIPAKNTTFETWIDSIEVGEVQENGNQEITIYIGVWNHGDDAIRMTWFCKLTDPNGKTYGGIGVSHGGNGARSDWIRYNNSEMARDYVVVTSDRDIAALSRGAVLDVYFMEKPLNDVPVTNIPDYHTTWTVNPGVIH